MPIYDNDYNWICHESQSYQVVLINYYYYYFFNVISIMYVCLLVFTCLMFYVLIMFIIIAHGHHLVFTCLFFMIQGYVMWRLYNLLVQNVFPLFLWTDKAIVIKLRVNMNSTSNNTKPTDNWLNSKNDNLEESIFWEICDKALHCVFVNTLHQVMMHIQ